MRDTFNAIVDDLERARLDYHPEDMVCIIRLLICVDLTNVRIIYVGTGDKRCQAFLHLYPKYGEDEGLTCDTL